MIDTKRNEKATGSFGTQSLLISVKIFSRAKKKNYKLVKIPSAPRRYQLRRKLPEITGICGFSHCLNLMMKCVSYSKTVLNRPTINLPRDQGKFSLLSCPVDCLDFQRTLRFYFIINTSKYSPRLID